ncbi:MAG TPA: DNA methyltransferase [Pyrinomonadaceae bacterium]
MSALINLIAKVKAKDLQLGADLEREFRVLSSRLSFGLNFERHRPEAVELPQRPVRRGDKVRVLPPRGSTARGDQRLWLVKAIHRDTKTAELELLDAADAETQTVALDDLIVVAEFRDTIYPGLVSTGSVSRGGDKPWHTVINGENYHVLKALTWTHRGKVDAIYIDPPYNTGARDWKYNNHYVEGDDLYRHSKWLAMMERRLLVAKELLKPDDSVLIVTIDEKEYLRLGLLLEQVFPEARQTMVSSLINPKGSARSDTFRRYDEYLFFVMFGKAAPVSLELSDEWRVTIDRRTQTLQWASLQRKGAGGSRSSSPNLFYPVFIRNTANGPVFDSVGESFFGSDWDQVTAPSGCVAVWPIRRNGSEGRWSTSPSTLRRYISLGYAQLGRWNEGGTTINYLTSGEQRKIETGVFSIIARRADNSVLIDATNYKPSFVPGTQWRIKAHNSGDHGASLVAQLLPNRRFPYPKALYAVEDALRFFVANKPEAVILDFFSGSGTTAHAVMRLNKQDGGRRQCISVTNNEVGADEQKALRERGLRPGDTEWECLGICDYITKPRVQAAITGKTPDGEPIKGDYKFTDEFPMSDGFEENAEFFTLTYETPVAVSYQTAFARIAPLLWLRAGSVGRRIDKLPAAGWDVADAYGLLVELDKATDFLKAAREAKALRIAYIVTDDERRFQALARRLPEGVEAIRLYESYLTNFAFANGDNA